MEAWDDIWFTAWKREYLSVLQEDQTNTLTSGAWDHRYPGDAFDGEGNYNFVNANAFHAHYLSSHPPEPVQMN